MEIFFLVIIGFIAVLVIALLVFSMSESKGLNSPHARGKKSVITSQRRTFPNGSPERKAEDDSSQQLS
jgi:hypothetical protein